MTPPEIDVTIGDEVQWSHLCYSGHGTAIRIVMGACEYAVIDTHRSDGICHAPLSLLESAEKEQ